MPSLVSGFASLLTSSVTSSGVVGSTGSVTSILGVYSSPSNVAPCCNSLLDI